MLQWPPATPALLLQGETGKRPLAGSQLNSFSSCVRDVGGIGPMGRNPYVTGCINRILRLARVLSYFSLSGIQQRARKIKEMPLQERAGKIDGPKSWGLKTHPLSL